jgi:hypothetical protein
MIFKTIYVHTISGEFGTVRKFVQFHWFTQEFQGLDVFEFVMQLHASDVNAYGD